MTTTAPRTAVEPLAGLLDAVGAVQREIAEVFSGVRSNVSTAHLSQLDRTPGDPARRAATALRAVIDDLNAQTAAATDFADRRAAATGALGRLADVFEAAAHAAGTAVQADVDAARAELTRLKQEHTTMAERLERAVKDGDVEQLLALRPRLELQLPAQVGQARLALLESEHRRHAAVAAAAQRIADAAGRRAAGGEDGTGAAARLAEAVRAAADEAAITARRRTAEAAERRDKLTVDLAADAHRRWARFAGLDAPAEPSRPAPAGTPPSPPLVQTRAASAVVGVDSSYRPPPTPPQRVGRLPEPGIRVIGNLAGLPKDRRR